ncbi:MAG: efflux RND transporter permease subunit, partial [Cyclobacteriaceae bacterium]
DLKFFEGNFKGIMPLEVVFDTGKKKGTTQLKTLKKIAAFEDFVAEHPQISRPVSAVSLLKGARQAFYNNKPKYYDLPSNRDRSFIYRYLRNQSDDLATLPGMVDSIGQQMRVSLKVADIGSDQMEVLVNETIQPKIDELFADTDVEAHITGTTLLFIKGNRFLIENLLTSLILAFVIIACIMALLFANFRMILISVVPNMIPLLITGGIMGFFDIPLKPSTALIFSIAFGISVDDSIHFLAKYRQELFANNFYVPIAISKSIRETGASMVYTSIVLFAGFVIFAGSEFGGTVALGILASATLLIAMFTNLIILPALLLTFDSGKRKKGFHPLIEQYDEFYQEDEDEEIDLDLIELQNENGVLEKEDHKEVKN